MENKRDKTNVDITISPLTAKHLRDKVADFRKWKDDRSGKREEQNTRDAYRDFGYLEGILTVLGRIPKRTPEQQEQEKHDDLVLRLALNLADELEREQIAIDLI